MMGDGMATAERAPRDLALAMGYACVSFGFALRWLVQFICKFGLLNIVLRISYPQQDVREIFHYSAESRFGSAFAGSILVIF